MSLNSECDCVILMKKLSKLEAGFGIYFKNRAIPRYQRTVITCTHNPAVLIQFLH